MSSNYKLILDLSLSNTSHFERDNVNVNGFNIKEYQKRNYYFSNYSKLLLIWLSGFSVFMTLKTFQKSRKIDPNWADAAGQPHPPPLRPPWLWPNWRRCPRGASIGASCVSPTCSLWSIKYLIQTFYGSNWPIVLWYYDIIVMVSRAGEQDSCQHDCSP